MFSCFTALGVDVREVEGVGDLEAAVGGDPVAERDGRAVGAEHHLHLFQREVVLRHREVGWRVSCLARPRSLYQWSLCVS